MINQIDLQLALSINKLPTVDHTLQGFIDEIFKRAKKFTKSNIRYVQAVVPRSVILDTVESRRNYLLNEYGIDIIEEF